MKLWMLRLFIAFCTTQFALSVAVVAGTRGLAVRLPTTSGETLELYKGSYALVLGNSSYKNGLDPLPGVRQDVKDVARALERNGFEVTAKTDLTRSEFQRAVAEFVLEYGRDPDNRLLFYYAGHGYTEPTATDEEFGYLIMVDAPNPAEDEIGFKLASLDMQYFITQSKLIKAKHVLFLFDSCFSGTILNFRATVKPKVIGDAVRYPVRQYITAGRANEPVPDRSVFKQAFVDILEGRAAEPIADGYLTGEELGLYLKTTVPQYSPNQHPQYGKIRDMQLDKGDFVFEIDPAGRRAAAEDERHNREQAALARQQAELEEQKRLAEQQAQLAALQAQIERLKLERERAALEQEKALLQEKQKLAQQRRELAQEKARMAAEQGQQPTQLARLSPEAASQPAGAVNKDKPWEGMWELSLGSWGSTRWHIIQEGDQVRTENSRNMLKARAEGDRIKGSVYWQDGDRTIISAKMSADGKSFRGSMSQKQYIKPFFTAKRIE